MIGMGEWHTGDCATKIVWGADRNRLNVYRGQPIG